MLRLIRNSWIAGTLMFLALAAVDWQWLHWGLAVDHVGGDRLLRRLEAQRPPLDNIVVLDIDQKSLEQMVNFAGSWPWPRAVHGELIEAIARQKPRAIVFDTMFTERDLFRNDSDLYLAEVLKSHTNVYLPMVVSNGVGSQLNRDLPATLGALGGPGANPDARSPLLLPIFDPALWRGGMINFLADNDGIGRSYHLYVRDEGWRFPSLPTAVAKGLGWTLPPGDEFVLNWRRPPRHISYADVYFDTQQQQPKRPQDEFRDQIVIIGAGAPGLFDRRPTPLGPNTLGVDILANAIANLQEGDWLQDWPNQSMLPLTALLIVGCALAFWAGVSAPWVAAGLCTISIGVVAAAWWQLNRGLALPVFACLLWGWMHYLWCALIGYLAERKRREQAVGLFQRFLDPRVVHALVSEGTVSMTQNPESRQITVLFSDIRGFTTLSETRTPEAIVNLLNRYFSLQVEIIFRHGGTLDKFIGDAIMAFWGAPVADPNHAHHAIEAAIEMGEAVQRFKAELTDLGADFDIGIGLNSGPAVVAFIGSNDRLDYTAIGDTVNLASRIEGETKGVARVLVSETTRHLAGEGYAYRDVGQRHVKGREQPVRLFEPQRKETS